jgi:AraC-like DNA-binding protein
MKQKCSFAATASNCGKDHVVVAPNEWSMGEFRVAIQDLSDVVESNGVAEISAGACRMLLSLDGDLQARPGFQKQTELYSIPAGACCLHYHPVDCVCRHSAVGRPGRMLEVACRADELAKIAGDTPLGRTLAAAIETGKPLTVRQTMGPSLQRSVSSLIDTVQHPGKGGVPLIMAKALEMLWNVIFLQEKQDRPGLVPAETRRAVEKAKTILEDNLAEPPPLETLSAEVGMSLSKFKEVFRWVCGMPPYAYLRRVRLERSRRLIIEGMNVTEAATAVGYSNLSHFSKTFARYHGIKPSRLSRRGINPDDMCRNTGGSMASSVKFPASGVSGT